MATRLPAKSILKQAPPEAKPTLSDEQKAQVERDRKNLAIALHHANRIQHQKDVEAQILSNIEALLDLPAGDAFTASEASKFVSLVHPFQPSDFDSIVEERRIDAKCGYALCASAPRSKTMGSSAAWKLKSQAAQDYCSNDCLRKALYVKSQLSEVPAWEREPGQQRQIVLQDEDVAHKTVAIGSTVVEPQDQSAGKEELARERGDTASSFRPGQVMASSVVEKAAVSRGPVDAGSVIKSHTAIEGYEPTMSLKQDQGSETTELSSMDDFIADDAETGCKAPIADSEESEAWRDFYNSIDKR